MSGGCKISNGCRDRLITLYRTYGWKLFVESSIVRSHRLRFASWKAVSASSLMIVLQGMRWMERFGSRYLRRDGYARTRSARSRAFRLHGVQAVSRVENPQSLPKCSRVTTHKAMVTMRRQSAQSHLECTVQSGSRGDRNTGKRKSQRSHEEANGMGVKERGSSSRATGQRY